VGYQASVVTDTINKGLFIIGEALAKNAKS